MASEKQTERAKKILVANPKAEAVWFTSDDSPFITEMAAKNHAKFLENKELVTVAKEEAGADAPDAGGKVVKLEPLEPVTKKALSKMNRAELEAECAGRTPAIEIPEGATNKDIADLITAADKAAEETKTPPVKGEGEE